MKNNKGFTVVELTVSFCLIATIAILLFQIILSLKEIYTNGDIKTGLLTKQALMTKKIKQDLNNKNLTAINNCDDNSECFRFVFNNTEQKDLVVDTENKVITYDGYSLNLNESSKFGQMTEENYVGTSKSGNNSIIHINIPITNELVDGDFGINIVHQYNSNSVVINNSLISTS